MKLSITVASIIALAAAAPVEVRDPQRNGVDLNEASFQGNNGAQLPPVSNQGDFVSAAPPGGFQNGAQLPPVSNQGGIRPGAPPGGFQNGAQLPQGFNPADSPGSHGDDSELVDVDRLTSGLVRPPPPSTGPKNANGLTAQNCLDVANGHSQAFAESLGSLCWGALDIHPEMA
ncbi:hypothetical protein MAJ_05337, partial [Metarhizium majus ARSEF 297]